MASRSVNKVILVGNLTRDPELRYTPQGTAVASFVVATNREWKTDTETKQVADFHSVVAWNKLAEICGQLLKKGTKVYVEGRLQTRDWVDNTGIKKYKTEVVIEDMVVLKQSGNFSGEGEMEEQAHPQAETMDTTHEEINLDDLNLDDLAGDSI